MADMIDIPSIGEILQEEFLEPLNLSQNALALVIGIPSNRINGIINGVRGMTADICDKYAIMITLSSQFLYTPSTIINYNISYKRIKIQ